MGLVKNIIIECIAVCDKCGYKKNISYSDYFNHHYSKALQEWRFETICVKANEAERDHGAPPYYEQEIAICPSCKRAKRTPK